MTYQQRLKLDVSVPFLCLFALYSAYLLFCLINPTTESGVIDVVYQLGAWFMFSWWICHDAAECRFVLPMSYGFLILFAPPIYGSVYLFQTRGRMGFVTIGLFVSTFILLFGIYIAAAAAMMLAEQ